MLDLSNWTDTKTLNQEVIGSGIQGIMWPSHLIVQIEVVKLPVGPEVLSVSVQGEVDVSAVAFDHHRVPVVVVQQAAAGDGGVTQDGAVLVAACNPRETPTCGRRKATWKLDRSRLVCFTCCEWVPDGGPILHTEEGESVSPRLICSSSLARRSSSVM